VKSKMLFRAVLAAALVFLCAGCDEHSYLNVWIVSGPDHVAPGDTATFVITSRATNCSPVFRYVMYWGDTSSTSAKSHSAGDTDRMRRVWENSGTYDVWATALLPQGSGYIQVNSSAHKTVTVSSVNDPVIDSARFHWMWRPVELEVFARAPAGESLRLAVEWGDGKSETTGFLPSPCRLGAIHSYAAAAQVQVVFRVLDESGRMSFPDTLSDWVSTDGEVTNFYTGGYSGSPVIASDGSEEIVYLVGSDGLYGLRPGGAKYISLGAFVGHPSFSSQTSHIYIGSDEGRLHAFTPTLGLAWSYPPSESVTYWEWGVAAVKGNALYVPRANDSLYCLVDNGSSALRGAAFGAQASLVDAPAVDAGGNVYFSTDSGYLYKLTAGLNLIWRTRLQAGGIVHGPVLDADGTVYCSSDSNRLYAVNPDDGSVTWTAPLAGTCLHPIVGSDAVYAGTSTGRLYKLHPGTGATFWEKQLGTDALSAAPVAAYGGYLYVQSGPDRVYYVNRSSGDSVWVTDCAAGLPRKSRGRTTRLNDGVSSPTVDANGRLWVVGTEAVYRLNSHAPLDAALPWPKWQHDVYNTGHVGGRR
jgi:outer membrane protein assembly factor BamB